MRLRSLLSRLPGGLISAGPPIVPVVRLYGPIGAAGMGGRRSLSLAAVAGPLQRAFSIADAPAVALSINSPGGAPTQSALIADRIRELAAEKKKPVLAFVEDVAASGGYWLASAGDEIFAQPTSIVGSIGVISAGFGFTDAIGKLGIERRVHTAGANKGLLDPFRPEEEKDLAKLREVQAAIHDAFIAQVKDRRGSRLEKAGDTDLFDGSFWTGDKGVELGLVDRLGTLSGVLKARYGEKVQIRLIGQRQGLLRLPLGFGGRIDGTGSADTLGGAIAAGGLAAVEERALWQRYGL